MQLAFEQYVANKMGMMKIMRMVNVVVAVKMIMGKMMMMMMVMANIMMSEWTRLGAFVYCHNAWSIRAIVFFNATHI